MRKGRHDRPSGDMRHFTNRLGELETFRRLADGPAGTPLPVVMFYGVGGTGKSWLARRLQQEAHDRLGLPTARLDFDPNAGGAGMHSDSASALAEIQRQLGVSCPRFELAYAMMLHKQGVKEAPTHRHAGDAWDLAGELTNVGLSELAKIPGAGLIVWFGKKVGAVAGGKLQGTALGQWVATATGGEDLLSLRRMTHQEIYPELAARLAEDLEDQLPRRDGKTCRAVVFLDTFEALKVGGQSGTSHHYAREEWVCRFYEKIGSVLLVLSGRDRLTWDEVDGDWRREEYLEQHLVGGLSETDARRFLAECGITQPPLQQAVLATSVDTQTPNTETAYHPFSLGLCADTIASDLAQGREPDPQSFRMPPGDYDALAARFLRSLPPHHEAWVLHLSLTPRFDTEAAKEAYARTVGGEIHHAWETLLDFSFLRPSGQEGWWTLHPRMRDALRARLARNSAAEHPAHAAWRVFWQSQCEQETDDAAGLAWYHLWRLDPAAAQTAWKQLAQGSRECLDMAGHYRLLDWWTPTDLERRGPSCSPQASALNDLGMEIWRASLGSRERNLHRAIGCYEAVLRVWTEDGFPQEWAMAQNNLGAAYQHLPTGDRAENLHRAIDCFEAALRIRTERDLPQEWGKIQNNLGIAYQNLPTGDQAENLRRAIEYYNVALRVRTEADYPQDWAMTQNNLGLTYQNLPTGNRAENLHRAIECYKSVLRVYTEGDFPQEWAMIQNNLGLTCLNSPIGDRTENLSRAIAHFEAALRVRTERDFPQEWAGTQINLGVAYLYLSSSDDRTENLRRAITCFEAALHVFTDRDFPQHWALGQSNLGEAYRNLSTADQAENLRRAIGHYEAALRVRTKRDFPQDWAGTQNNLGVAYQDLPADDRSEGLRQAIKYYDAALQVYTECDFPEYWAMTQNNLGNAYQDLPAGDRAENLDRAIQYYEAALRVRTKCDYPQAWAETRLNAGLTYRLLGERDNALAAFTDAIFGFRLVGHAHYLQMAEDELAKLSSKDAGADSGA